MSTSVSSADSRPAPVDVPTGRLDGASKLRVFSVLAVIVLFTEIAPLQYTMVAAALQKMSGDFPSVGANISWALIIFGLIGASASPLIGKMSDVWGKKRLFLICGLLFVVGCLVDALTHSWALFLVGRALQALAIATQVVAYGLIRDLLPRRYVPLGLGVTATGLGFSAIAAPLVGGWLVDNYSWRAIFWFLVAFTAVMAPVVMLVVPESRLRVRERIDFAGAVLLSAGATLVLLYLDKGQDWGWGRASALAWLFGGLAMLAAFVVIETRVRVPIMDIRLLFHPKVALVLCAALFASCMIGLQGYAIAYMTETPNSDVVSGGVVRAAVAKMSQLTGHPVPAQAVSARLDPGYSYGNGFGLLGYAVHVALLQAVLAMVAGAVAGVVARRVGARLPLVAGLVVFVAAGVCYAVLPHTWQWFMVIGGVYGFGFGFYYAAMPNLIVEAVPQEQQGISVGMLGVMNSMGAAIGPAILTAFLTAHPVRAHVLLGGHEVGSDVVPQVYADHGYHLGFWAIAITSAVALVIAILMRHGRTPATGGE